MKKGTIKWYNESKGFGFITPDGGGEEIFVHSASVRNDNRTLSEGDKVNFDVIKGPKGPTAINVVRA